jgi:hypothetical protein
MKKTEDVSPLNGFDNIINSITPPSHDSDVAMMDEITDVDDSNDVKDLSFSQDKDGSPIPDDKTKVEKQPKADAKGTAEIDFTDEEPIEGKDKKNSDTEETVTSQATTPQDEDNSEEEVDEGEQQGVSQFFDAFSEALGWQVDEENKPTTVEDLVDYMKQVVDENSTPDYSDDRVKQLDEYVKKGGNFEDFYGVQSQETNYDKLDMEDTSAQKLVIQDYLKMSGFNDDQIKRKISRFEDAGLLEDEAKDNLEVLKEYKENEKRQLQEEQTKTQQDYEEKQKNLINDITTNINSLTEIRGIKVPTEDRKKLLDYAFKVDMNGETQFQKDYAKNATKNFIETAYFSMKGDALLNSAKHSGESSAVNKLKQTLKTSIKHNKTTNSVSNSSARPVWTAASNLFGS